MTVAARKIQLIEHITKMEDEALLGHIEALIIGEAAVDFDLHKANSLEKEKAEEQAADWSKVQNIEDATEERERLPLNEITSGLNWSEIMGRSELDMEALSLEQNYKGIDRAKIEQYVEAIDLHEPLEELID